MKERPAEKPAQKKRAFIYCRTSVDSETDDGEKVSIETQELSSRELAKRHGYEVVDVFTDRNRSGRLYPTGFEIPDKAIDLYISTSSSYGPTNRTRKGLGKLMSRINEIDVIIVRNADRLMRPYTLSFLGNYILSILREHNIVIHSHDDNIIDPHNSDNLLIFDLKASVASRYIVDRQNETKIGMNKRRDDGQLYFPPNFYGFRSVGHQKVSRVEAEIAVVQRIFKEFVEGKTLKAIAKDLNSDRIPTLKRTGKSKEGKGYWLDCTIRAILKRPQYAGFQYKSNGVDEVQVQVYHPPVILNDVFKQVQARFDEGKKHYVGNTKNVHGLTGLVRCGYCGYQLYTTATYVVWGGRKHKMESFRCITPSKSKEATQCKGIQIRERITKGLKRKDGTPYSNGLEDCLFPLVYKGYINHLIAKERRVGLDDDIDALKSKLERSRTFRKNLGQKLSDGIINDKTFDELIKDSIQANSKDEDKLAQLQKEANDIDRIDIPKNLFTDYASHQVSNEIKRKLFHNVIDHIDVWHEHCDVYIKGGKSFRLDRLRLGKTFVLPSWRVVEINSNSFTSKEGDGGVKRISHKHTPITVDTHIDVVYTYDNDDPMTVIYGDDNLTVMTEGTKKVTAPK